MLFLGWKILSNTFIVLLLFQISPGNTWLYELCLLLLILLPFSWNIVSLSVILFPVKNNITGRVILAIICKELQGVITSTKASDRELSVKMFSFDLYLSHCLSPPLLSFSSTKGKSMFVPFHSLCWLVVIYSTYWALARNGSRKGEIRQIDEQLAGISVTVTKT